MKHANYMAAFNVTEYLITGIIFPQYKPRYMQYFLAVVTSLAQWLSIVFACTILNNCLRLNTLMVHYSVLSDWLFKKGVTCFLWKYKVDRSTTYRKWKKSPSGYNYVEIMFNRKLLPQAYIQLVKVEKQLLHNLRKFSISSVLHLIIQTLIYFLQQSGLYWHLGSEEIFVEL